MSGANELRSDGDCVGEVEFGGYATHILPVNPTDDLRPSEFELLTFDG